MSREAYQVPSLGGQNAFGGGGAAGGATDGFAGSVDGPVVAYLCGECNSRVSLKRGDQIRCKECGHRVLYKERTKRFVHLSLSLFDPCPLDCVAFDWGGDVVFALWLSGFTNMMMNRMVQFEAR